MSVFINHSSLAKGWKRYQIMHKNRRVASIREDGSCTIYFPAFMPYNLYLERAEDGDVDTRVNNLTNFYYWCASRVLTLDRTYVKQILNSIGAAQATTDRERAMIAISYHGICLTDVYWIKTDGENLRYEDISLYRHSLSGAFADVSLRGHQLTAQNAELLKPNDIAGDVATQGVAPKAWIRENGEFYLLKDGDLRDVKAELLASRLASCFDMEYVPYEAAEYAGTQVSRSRLITSEERGIVPMEYVDIYCLNHNLDRNALIKRTSEKAYCMMNLFDYLIGNSDRHGANWGFWVNHQTNRLTCLYPLMDFNKAFTAYSSLDGGLCLTVDSVSISQREAAETAVRCVGLNMISEPDPAWFDNPQQREMFFKRLEVCRKVLAKRKTE